MNLLRYLSYIYRSLARETVAVRETQGTPL